MIVPPQKQSNDGMKKPMRSRMNSMNSMAKPQLQNHLIVLPWVLQQRLAVCRSWPRRQLGFLCSAHVLVGALEPVQKLLNFLIIPNWPEKMFQSTSQFDIILAPFAFMLDLRPLLSKHVDRLSGREKPVQQ